MSLTRQIITTFVAMTVTWLPAAHAQRIDDGSDRFFTAKVATDKDDESSVVTQGSLTSTSFLFRELGGLALGANDPLYANNYNNSRVTRFFTDLRAQLTVKRLDGQGWSMRADARVRVSPGCAFTTDFQGIGDAVNCRTQSGILGGNEYDIRELYAKRSSGKTDIFIGRQFVPELAATKLDGLKFHYDVSKRWKLIGFGGLNPSRISRSVLTDYPASYQAVDLTQGVDNAIVKGAPVLPVTAGMGGSYRTPDVYGSFGAVGIIPIVTDRQTQAMETPRVFITDNGYWRPTSHLDIYHYLVLDLTGADTFALTNLSLGANYRPKPGITLSGAFNRVDTETLNSITQTQILEAPLVPIDNVISSNLPYNFQNVMRVASDSAQLGASFAFARQRFEISTRAFYRQREEVALVVPDRVTPPQLLPAARTAEIRISVLDRRSVGGMRLGASFSSIFPLTNNTPNRSQAQMASITGSKLFLKDRMEYDVNLAFTSSSDIKEIGACLAPINCYGNSDVIAVQTNNLLYYRFSKNWFGIANIGVGIQRLTDENGPQPLNILLNGLMRVAYRF